MKNTYIISLIIIVMLFWGISIHTLNNEVFDMKASIQSMKTDLVSGMVDCGYSNFSDITALNCHSLTQTVKDLQDEVSNQNNQIMELSCTSKGGVYTRNNIFDLGGFTIGSPANCKSKGEDYYFSDGRWFTNVTAKELK